MMGGEVGGEQENQFFFLRTSIYIEQRKPNIAVIALFTLKMCCFFLEKNLKLKAPVSRGIFIYFTFISKNISNITEI